MCWCWTADLTGMFYLFPSYGLIFRSKFQVSDLVTKVSTMSMYFLTDIRNKLTGAQLFKWYFVFDIILSIIIHRQLIRQGKANSWGGPLCPEVADLGVDREACWLCGLFSTVGKRKGGFSLTRKHPQLQLSNTREHELASLVLAACAWFISASKLWKFVFRRNTAEWYHQAIVELIWSFSWLGGRTFSSWIFGISDQITSWLDHSSSTQWWEDCWHSLPMLPSHLSEGQL